MADLSFTSAQVRRADPRFDIVIDFIAGVAISAGQGVYINSSGKAALADASAAGTAVCVGIALQSVSAEQVVPVLYQGFVYGFDLSSVAYNTLISVSDTAGDLDNGAGSPTVAAPVGRVMPVSEGGTPTKLLYVDCSTNMTVLPA